MSDKIYYRIKHMHAKFWLSLLAHQPLIFLNSATLLVCYFEVYIIQIPLESTSQPTVTVLHCYIATSKRIREAGSADGDKFPISKHKLHTHAQAALPPTSISKIRLLTVGAKIYREQQNKDLKKGDKGRQKLIDCLENQGRRWYDKLSGVVRDGFLDGLTSRTAGCVDQASWRRRAEVGEPLERPATSPRRI
jgi:hypothetical protein